MSIRKEGDATDRFQMKVPLSVKEITSGKLTVPDYDKKKLIASFQGIKHYHTQQQVKLKVPEDGFLYVWIAGHALHLKDFYKKGFVAINSNLISRSIKTGRVFWGVRELFGTDNVYGYGNNYVRPGEDVIYPIHDIYNQGYFSDLIPVSKGQNVVIMRPQGDLDTYVYLIPPKN